MNKIKRVTFIGAAAALLALTGCAWLQAHRQDVATTAKLLAYDGTALAVHEHPEWKPAFITAAADLKVIEDSPQPSLQDVLTIVRRLPVKELKSPAGVLIIGNITILLERVGNPAIDARYVEDVKSFVRALREGIHLAVGPSACGA